MHKIAAALSGMTIIAAIALVACGPAGDGADGVAGLPDARATVAAVLAPTPTLTPKPTPTRAPLPTRQGPTPQIRVTVDPTEVALPPLPTPTPSPFPTPTFIPTPTPTLAPTLTLAPDLAMALANAVVANSYTIYLIDTSPSFDEEFDQVRTALDNLTNVSDFDTTSVQLMTFDDEVATELRFQKMGAAGGVRQFQAAVAGMRPAPDVAEAETLAFTGIDAALGAFVFPFKPEATVLTIYTDGKYDDLHRAAAVIQRVRDSSADSLIINVIGYGVEMLWDCDSDGLAPANDLLPAGVDWDAYRTAIGFGDSAAWEWDDEKLLREQGLTVEELFNKYCLKPIERLIELTELTGGAYEEVEAN